MAINLNLFTAAKKKSAESIYRVTKEFDDGIIEGNGLIQAPAVPQQVGRNRPGRLIDHRHQHDRPDRQRPFNMGQPGDKLNFSTADSGGAVPPAARCQPGILSYNPSTNRPAPSHGQRQHVDQAGLTVGIHLQDSGYVTPPEQARTGFAGRLAHDQAGHVVRLNLADRTASGSIVDGTAVSGDLNDIALKLAGDMSSTAPSRAVDPAHRPADRAAADRLAAHPPADHRVSASGWMADSSILKISEIASGMSAQVGPYRMKVIGTRHCPSNRIYITRAVDGSATPAAACVLFATEGSGFDRASAPAAYGPRGRGVAGFHPFCSLGCRRPAWRRRQSCHRRPPGQRATRNHVHQSQLRPGSSPPAAVTVDVVVGYSTSEHRTAKSGARTAASSR